MQPKLFEKPLERVSMEDVLLYALGDFQSRGKVLAGRELAFNRLRGAFLRAFTKFGIAELSDEIITEELQKLGVSVAEVPDFIAKRPYRITVNSEMGRRAFEAFKESQESELR